MNLRTLRTIIELFEASSAVEIELDNASIGKLRLRRSETGVAPVAAVIPAAPKAVAAPAAAAAPPPAADDENLHEVVSPFVGTFYRAPGPDAEVFVNVGDRVKAGQTLCIIEAMKLMNELESDCDGVVEAILVDNGTPVEHGQALITIRPS